MKTIKVQCPAKINLDLKIVNRRPDGFHNIDSVMQTISLYDYLTISAGEAPETKITLSGTSDEIPYDEKNLVYKAAIAYLEAAGLKAEVNVFIDKNIPVAAGLAGGSTDGAGVIYGLNKIFDDKMTSAELHGICAKLGSDLNFCLQGGRAKTSGRGEILKPVEFVRFNLNLIKPIGLGISAGEAYSLFSAKNKPEVQNQRSAFINDLEWAVLENYPQLQYIKNTYPSAVMTGSGPAYFSTSEEFKATEGYWMKNGLCAVNFGVTGLVDKLISG